VRSLFSSDKWIPRDDRDVDIGTGEDNKSFDE